jgi:non-ribosomal peptide synthetase component F
LKRLSYGTSISTSQLDHAARALSASPQALVQSAYAVILSSYLGTSDICFGNVFSGRTKAVADIEEIAGPTLSTLPIRVALSGVSTPAELVQSINFTIRKHLAHDNLSLREIKAVAEVQDSRPLFDTLFVWQQTAFDSLRQRRHVQLVDSVDYLEFNLTLEVVPGNERLQFLANYQRAIFPKEQVDILLRQVEALVKEFIESPKTPLQNCYDALPPDTLSIVGPGSFVAEIHPSLAYGVELVAKDDPSRPALHFVKTVEGDAVEVQALTYAELNAKANQIAHYLISQGVHPDDLVCICMDKSFELYASILGTIKAGAGYVPITSDTPVERIQHILQQAKVKHILASFATMDFFENYAASGTVTDVFTLDYSLLSTRNPPLRSTPSNLAYCVFTSGTSGEPKGILVEIGNLLTNVETLKEKYPNSSSTKLLQSCSQAFDVSMFEIFWTWRVGGCLCESRAYNPGAGCHASEYDAYGCESRGTGERAERGFPGYSGRSHDTASVQEVDGSSSG